PMGANSHMPTVALRIPGGMPSDSKFAKMLARPVRFVMVTTTSTIRTEYSACAAM
ncbi:uncharacterized protein SEPMUDRAFT_36734, partial [Sphaerulina musiva SO2202]